MKKKIEDGEHRHEITGMIEIYDQDGREHACAAGLRTQVQEKLRQTGQGYAEASKLASNTPHKWVFGICHPYWKDFFTLKDPQNPAEVDYRQWVTEVMYKLGLQWYFPNELPLVITPPLKYNQLVYVMTLLRHPVEVSRGPVYCYTWMKEHKTDPLGTLIGMAYPHGLVRNNDYWDYKSPFHGAVGHGFGDCSIKLIKANKYNDRHLRAFNVRKGLEDLKESIHTFGTGWAFEKKRFGYTSPRQVVKKAIPEAA